MSQQHFNTTVNLSTFEHLEQRLHNLGMKPKGGMALCPAHSDTTPSMAYSKGHSQPWVVRCFAGCKQEDVLDVIYGKKQPVARENGSKAKKRRPRRGVPSRTVAEYPYYDEDGALLYKKLRLEPKSFRFRTPGGGWSLPDGQRRVPYRLDEIAAARKGQTCFITEGEKDADRLRSMGFVATCNDNGAGKWVPDEENKCFDGLHILILPDNDDPGRAHGDLVAAAVYPHAETVKVVQLPGLDDGGDVSDFFDAGNTIADVIEVALDAPFWAPEGQDDVGTGDWPKRPDSEVGFIASIYPKRTKLAPLYGGVGNIKESPAKQYEWILRLGNQILAEARHATIYHTFYDNDDNYERAVERLKYRRESGRIVWRSVPQDDGGRIVWHNDPAEGGIEAPLHRPHLFAVLQRQVRGIDTERRSTGSSDWGMEYEGSEGDGRRNSDAALQLRCEVVLATAKLNLDEVEDFDTASFNVTELVDRIRKTTRKVAAGMMASELVGKARKTVLKALLSKLKDGPIQLLAGRGILDAAKALGIRLNKWLFGSVLIDMDDAIERIARAGIPVICRGGRHWVEDIYGTFPDKQQETQQSKTSVAYQGNKGSGKTKQPEPPPLSDALLGGVT